MTFDSFYIKAMREQADAKRAEAAGKVGEERDWLLSRARFFEECAEEAELLQNETQRSE